MMQALRKDGSVNVMVESPRGSTIKFKYERRSARRRRRNAAGSSGYRFWPISS
jgi:hypothetical protein